MYITDLVNRIRNILVREQLVDAETFKPLPDPYKKHHLRQITLYIMVNTDAKFKYDLDTEPSISHFVNTIVPVPKCLLHSIVFELHLDWAFGECIAYTPGWFAYQFLIDIADSIKHYEAFAIVDYANTVLQAIYTNIARSIFHSADSVTDRKILFNKMFVVLSEVVHFIHRPIPSDDMKRTMRSKYVGHIVSSNLELLLYSLELYLNRPVLGKGNVRYAMYELMKEKDPLVDDGDKAYSEDIIETMDRINVLFLNALQDNLMEIDVRIYLDWSEIEGVDRRSVQQQVGELAYQLDEILSANECFEHAVHGMLRAFIIKPQTLEEKIADCNIGRLIEELELICPDTGDNKTLSLWLDGFLDRGALVLNNAECLDTLAIHRKSLGVDQVKRMIDFVVDCDNSDESIEDKLIDICVHSLDNFDDDTMLDVILYSMENRAPDSEIFEMENFSQALIEVFNKTTIKAARKPFIKLLFQNPQKFFDKVFAEALLSNVQLVQTFEVLNHTVKAFQPLAATHLSKLIETPPDSLNAQFLPKLLAHLFTLDVIEPHEFIIETLYKRFLTDALANKNYARTLLIVTTLWNIRRSYKFGTMCAPLLVVCSQVLELCRWDCTTFTTQKTAIVLQTIDLVVVLKDAFLPTASKLDISWVSKNVQSNKKLTRYYFRELIDHGAQHPTFVEYLGGPKSGEDLTRNQAHRFLCEQLVRCTANEMVHLANDSRLLPYFWDAIKLIAAIVSQSDTTTGENCLKYISVAFLKFAEVSYERHINSAILTTSNFR